MEADALGQARIGHQVSVTASLFLQACARLVKRDRSSKLSGSCQAKFCADPRKPLAPQGEEIFEKGPMGQALPIVPATASENGLVAARQPMLTRTGPPVARGAWFDGRLLNQLTARLRDDPAAEFYATGYRINTPITALPSTPTGSRTPVFGLRTSASATSDHNIRRLVFAGCTTCGRHRDRPRVGSGSEGKPCALAGRATTLAAEPSGAGPVCYAAGPAFHHQAGRPMNWIATVFHAVSQPFRWWFVVAPWEAALRIRGGKRAKLCGPGTDA